MELIKETRSVNDATGWYLTQSVLIECDNIIIDGETNEERHQLWNKVICEKGLKLTEIDISTLIENGIETVQVSNIPLKGSQQKYLNLWETILKVISTKGESKKTYIVKADCPSDAEKFISEWHETNIEADFEIIKVNKLDYNKVIKMYETEKDEYEQDGKKKVKWFKCQIYITLDDDEDSSSSSSQRNILCQATGFEKAIDAIKSVLGNNEYDNIYNTFKLLQEIKIEEVFIPEESVNYYSNSEL